MQSGPENSNVIPLAFGKDKKPALSAKEAPLAPEVPSEDHFAETMRKNEEVRRKMAQDRAKANRSVLKSYRIKT